jgi:hypothetical protein
MVREVHPDIESMVQTTVADVLLALEEFVRGIAKELGLVRTKNFGDTGDMGIPA